MLASSVILAILLGAAQPATRSADARALAQNINVWRHALGRRVLRLDAGLHRVALEHALDMANRGYFSHRSPGGVSPFARFDQAHVRFRYGGEDLEFDRNVTSAEGALWRSQPHRRNALQVQFTRIGVGAVRTAHGELFVEDFSG